jgi:hypothetical protein
LALHKGLQAILISSLRSGLRRIRKFQTTEAGPLAVWPGEQIEVGGQDMMKLFLLVAGVFLIPVALSYGVDPAATRKLRLQANSAASPTLTGWAKPKVLAKCQPFFG